MPPKRQQAHQNAYKFKHNKNSKLTQQILSFPNKGVCQRCYEQIEWRKTYRKYKPRTVPGKCVNCSLKNVRYAYHSLCENCAVTKGVCAKCTQTPVNTPGFVPFQEDEPVVDLKDELYDVPERYRRTIRRKLESGELTLEQVPEFAEQYRRNKDDEFTL
eukprot:TRINITY_DN9675_c0_g1_i1.p1 TRINITY_DN9675_c0_g1~~TRINITY_DN9675_c0_g1_i1.p1  ORF type:complete len:159 (-),score=32.71 TRINITY_DN9675_c0_g1_i1:60-536(-)